MKTITRSKLESLIAGIDLLYGDLKSTHEGLGVISGEYHELLEAVRSNAAEEIWREAIDLAAACIRLADAVVEPSTPFHNRSKLHSP